MVHNLTLRARKWKIFSAQISTWSLSFGEIWAIGSPSKCFKIVVILVRCNILEHHVLQVQVLLSPLIRLISKIRRVRLGTAKYVWAHMNPEMVTEKTGTSKKWRKSIRFIYCLIWGAAELGKALASGARDRAFKSRRFNLAFTSEGKSEARIHR